MASANPVATKKYFSVEEANKTLPLVKQIVGDIVRQFEIVSDLDARLSGVLQRDAKRRANDPYTEELAHTKAELAAEEEKLNTYREELERLGVELKGTDGLCDFPSLKDGREVYLCWRLGEPDDPALARGPRRLRRPPAHRHAERPLPPGRTGSLI